MPPPTSPTRRLAAVVVGGLLLGACHSGSTAASHGTAESATTATAADSPGVTAPSVPGPACTVASAALVSSKLGVTLTGPNLDQGPAATICTYDDPSNQPQSATVQVTTGATTASFASGRSGFASHGETVTDVVGLGNEAYSATLSVANITNTTMVARKGSVEVLITTTAPADRVPALMTAVLALV